MDEKIVRGLRKNYEQPEIVCARQMRLQMPGTVLKRISSGGRWTPSFFTRHSIAKPFVEEVKNLRPDWEFFMNSMREK